VSREKPLGGKPYLSVVVVRKRHAEIGADDIHNGLSVLWLILGKAFKGVESPEPDRSLVVTQLFYCLAIQFGNAPLSRVKGVVTGNIFGMYLSTFT
jgi:hypothetical protein